MISFQNSIINSSSFYKHIQTLTNSQKEFIRVLQNWFENRKNLFVLVSGGPGSGKTHTVVKTLEYIRAEKIFMAPTARLASKIGGRTIHSQMRLNWTNGSVLKQLEQELVYVDNIDECIDKSIVLKNELEEPLSSVEIVVIDEVGMLPFWLLYRIIEKYFTSQKQNRLVICMGDSCQLKPVTSNYNVFQVPFDCYFNTVSIKMRESKRFSVEYKIIIDELRSFMAQLDVEKIFDSVRTNYPIVTELTEELLLKANRVLAYKNNTVDSCNSFYLNTIMKKEKIYKFYECKDNKVQWVHNLRQNCTVVVTENNCSAVSNGTSLIFKDYNKQKDVALCYDEGGKRPVIIYRSKRTGRIPLTLGFAVTIHKFQGETIDENNIIFNFDSCEDLHLVYTALSRVRNGTQILAVIL